MHCPHSALRGRSASPYALIRIITSVVTNPVSAEQPPIPPLTKREKNETGGSFREVWPAAGWFNRRRFLAESTPHCSTGHAVDAR